MAAMARAGPGGNWEPNGWPTWVQGYKHLGHPRLLSQAPEQETGWEGEQLGLNLGSDGMLASQPEALLAMQQHWPLLCFF